MRNELPLPCAIEVEEEILGCLLTDSGDHSLEIIEKAFIDDFFVRSNRLIFETIKHLNHSGMAFDMISVIEKMKADQQLDDIGSQFYLNRLITRHAPGFMALKGLDILKEKTRLRSLINLGNEMIDKGYQCEKSSDIIETTESKLNSTSLVSDSNNLLESGVDRLKEMVRARLNGEKIYGIPTGIKSFDDIFFGLQASQMYVFAGRPSAGKTACVDQIAWRLIEDNIPTLYIPLESSEDRTVGKIACKMCRISFTRFVQNKCNESELKSIDKMADKIKNSSLIMKRPESMTADSLRSMIRREIRKNGIKVFIIDYLQKINQGGNDERTSIAQACTELQNICVDTKAIGLVIVQMNRDADKESRPRMSHIKESGQIEQDADNICLFWSEKENHELEPGEMKPSIITIEKNKDGIQGVDQKLLFDRELMTFKERSKYE